MVVLAMAMVVVVVVVVVSVQVGTAYRRAVEAVSAVAVLQQTLVAAGRMRMPPAAAPIRSEPPLRLQSQPVSKHRAVAIAAAVVCIVHLTAERGRDRIDRVRECEIRPESLRVPVCAQRRRGVHREVEPRHARHVHPAQQRARRGGQPFQFGFAHESANANTDTSASPASNAAARPRNRNRGSRCSGGGRGRSSRSARFAPAPAGSILPQERVIVQDTFVFGPKAPKLHLAVQNAAGSRRPEGPGLRPL
mmetsp:Transcript_30100/g.52892  ORF Transcript_30100/g.52892 Transcript_30100/m.52892 type:complete len:249 (-) Transcript_30100:212-958(-)